ncbi:Calx-beta domain-containing protein [Leifsonia sp. SIMBA_070]|uniref:Calx-beta domain-containing protein n=1 Tax=Leifsonia sp. SIMBA_070 TaxID=3085810 RepID=UPI00397813E6
MSRPHARLRLACALTLAGLGALLGAAPAVAAGETAPVAAPASPVPPAPSAPALTPLVDCVQDAPLGAVAVRTVVVGYRSSEKATVTLPAGTGANDLTAGAADRGQPTVFEPGEHHRVWLLTVDAAVEPDLAWRLGGTEVRFDAAPACTAATAVAVSAPAEVAAGGVASVSATVSRMLLAPPSTGTVAFSLDGGPAVPATVTAEGVARADLLVPSAGSHTVSATYQPGDGSGLLSSAGSATLTATPASAPLTVSADSVVAGSTSVLITVSRPSPEGSATVDVMTADGTARAGADYTAVSTTIALSDGETTASLRTALPARPAGAPATSFFVLLQRASTTVATASAAVHLPAVPSGAATAAAGVGQAGSGGGPGVSSVLPPDDPTAAAPAAANAAQDLAVLVGGILLTVGGILGVVGLVRAAGMREARA